MDASENSVNTSLRIGITEDDVRRVIREELLLQSKEIKELRKEVQRISKEHVVK